MVWNTDIEKCLNEKWKPFWTFLGYNIFLFLFGCFNTESIYAHNEIKVENYTIEAGWEEEPPLVNIVNNIVVQVFENESPVRNTMKDLSVNINYSGSSKELSFVPSEESSGLYFADIIPSKLGSYSLTVKGNINIQNIENDPHSI